MVTVQPWTFSIVYIPINLIVYFPYRLYKVYNIKLKGYSQLT